MDAELQEILEELDRVNQRLQSWKERNRHTWQFKWPLTPIDPLPITPIEDPLIQNKCPECNLRFDQGPLGYVCGNPKCPTGLGGVWCNTNETKSGDN